MQYKISLHNHVPDFSSSALKTKDSRKNLENLISKLLTLSTQNETLVLGIATTNGNNRYKNFLKEIKTLEDKYQIDFKNQDAFISLSKEDKKIYFVKCDEMEVDLGHFLVVGYQGDLKKDSLKNVLQKSRSQNCPVIANHPLRRFNLPYYLLDIVILKSPNMSSNERTLKKYKKYIDALELSAYFPQDWKKIKKFAQKNKFNLISDSDSHFPSEVFTSWYSTENIDFKNPKTFKDSLKKAINSNLFLSEGKHPWYSSYRHGFQVLFRIVIRKLKLNLFNK